MTILIPFMMLCRSKVSTSMMSGTQHFSADRLEEKSQLIESVKIFLCTSNAFHWTFEQTSLQENKIVSICCSEIEHVMVLRFILNNSSISWITVCMVISRTTLGGSRNMVLTRLESYYDDRKQFSAAVLCSAYISDWINGVFLRCRTISALDHNQQRTKGFRNMTFHSNMSEVYCRSD